MPKVGTGSDICKGIYLCQAPQTEGAIRLTFGAAGGVRFQRPDDHNADRPLLAERPSAGGIPNCLGDASQSVVMPLIHRKFA